MGTKPPTAIPTAPPTVHPTRHPNPEPTEAATPTPTNAPTPQPAPTESAACSANPACAALSGDCCPVPNGPRLECCLPALFLEGQASAVEESLPFGFSVPAFIGGGIIGSLAVLVVLRTRQAGQFGTRAPLLARE